MGNHWTWTSTVRAHCVTRTPQAACGSGYIETYCVCKYPTWYTESVLPITIGTCCYNGREIRFEWSVRFNSTRANICQFTTTSSNKPLKRPSLTQTDLLVYTHTRSNDWGSLHPHGSVLLLLYDLWQIEKTSHCTYGICRPGYLLR